MLVVKLLRTYGDRGTNGEIWIGGDLECCAIELPWRENVRNISCIPEGTYPLAKRYSKRFGWHILVRDVPMRSAILFHPANNAEKELRGCIAPVKRCVVPIGLALFFAKGACELCVGLPMATAARATCRRAKLEAAVDGVVLHGMKWNTAPRQTK